MTAGVHIAPSELFEFAVHKIGRVLGSERARRLVESTLEQLALELRDPQDLLRLSEAISKRGGFEGAAGAMLGVAAVIRGATAVVHDV